MNAVVELELDAAGDPHAPARATARARARRGPARRAPKNAPRVLDLDLLFSADAVVKSAELTVPHPGLTRRRFVLAPLAELAPALVPPGETRSVAALLQDLDDPLRVEKLGRPISEDPR